MVCRVTGVKRMDDAEYDLMESIAEDSLSLIRLSVFIIAVFSTIAAYMAESPNQEPPTNSLFTIFGAVIMIAMITGLALTYRNTRKRMYGHIRDDHNLNTEETINDFVVLVIGIVVSVYCFLVGLAETTAIGYFSSRDVLALVMVPIFTLIMMIGIAESIRTSISAFYRMAERIRELPVRVKRIL